MVESAESQMRLQMLIYDLNILGLKKNINMSIQALFGVLANLMALITKQKYSHIINELDKENFAEQKQIIENEVNKQVSR